MLKAFSFAAVGSGMTVSETSAKVTSLHVTEREAGGLRCRRKEKGEETIALDRAAGEYLWLLRDARVSRAGTDPHLRSLLFAHTGRLHRRLPDLAFLYLLHAVATPDILKF